MIRFRCKRLRAFRTVCGGARGTGHIREYYRPEAREDQPSVRREHVEHASSALRQRPKGEIKSEPPRGLKQLLAAISGKLPRLEVIKGVPGQDFSAWVEQTYQRSLGVVERAGVKGFSASAEGGS